MYNIKWHEEETTHASNFRKRCKCHELISAVQVVNVVIIRDLHTVFFDLLKYN